MTSATQSSSLLGWATIDCPYFPAHTTGRGASVSVQVRRTTVVPWSFRNPARRQAAEFQNEGTPFRCLGLHTHRKDPAEAQARFSEDILQLKFHRTHKITAAQPSQAGQTQLAEPFKYSNSCRARQSFAERCHPPNLDTQPRIPAATHQQCRGFRVHLRGLRSEAIDLDCAAACRKR
jgi:hypothetical protein